MTSSITMVFPPPGKRVVLYDNDIWKKEREKYTGGLYLVFDMVRGATYNP